MLLQTQMSRRAADDGRHDTTVREEGNYILNGLRAKKDQELLLD